MSAMEQARAQVELAVSGETAEPQRAWKTVLGAVNGGQVSLQDLVQLLGSCLTSTDELFRARGMRLLAEVLATATQAVLPQATCTHLVAFFCDRLKDAPCVRESLSGLLALLSSRDVNGDGSILVAQSMFAELAVQGLQQPVRNLVYRVCSVLLLRFGDSMRTIGAHFGESLVTAMDGEKDPRNLVITFRLVLALVNSGIEEATGELAEELFDVISCYYPITFEAPPGDKYGVTGDDLRAALAAAFCATPVFARFCLPLLIQKLEASNGNTKLDCLETLRKCVPAFGPEAVSQYLPALWQQVAVESAHIDARVAISAAETAAVLVREYAAAPAPEPASAGNSTPWHPHLRTAVKSVGNLCISAAQTLPSSTHKVTCASRLLHQVAGVSAAVLCELMAELLHLLLPATPPPSSSQQQGANVQMVCVLLECARRFAAAKATAEVQSMLTGPFAAHKAALLQLLIGVLEAGAAEETRAGAVRCLGNLLALAAASLSSSSDGGTSQLLDAAEAELALSQLSKATLSMCERAAGSQASSPSSSVDAACLDAFSLISAHNPAAVTQHCLLPVHTFLEALIADSAAATAEAEALALQTLVAMAKAHDAHFAWVLGALAADLHKLLQQLAPAAAADESVAARAGSLSCQVLSALAAVFSKVPGGGEEETSDGEEKGAKGAGTEPAAAECVAVIYSTVVEFVVAASAAAADQQPTALSSVVVAATKALQAIMCVLPSAAQQAVLPAVVESLFLHTSSEGAGSPSSTVRSAVLKLSAGVLTRLAPGVSAVALATPSTDTGGTKGAVELAVLLQGACLWPDVTAEDCAIAGQCLGSLLNKLQLPATTSSGTAMAVDDNDGTNGDVALAAAQPKILSFLIEHVSGGGGGGETSAATEQSEQKQRLLCGESLSWVAKGLIQRGDRQASRQLIQLFVGLLTAAPTASSSMETDAADSSSGGGGVGMAALAAKALQVIVAEHPGGVLSAGKQGCHAVVRGGAGLCAQKVFALSLPPLMAFVKADNPDDDNGRGRLDLALLAIANMCAHVPPSALASEIDNLVAAMTRALSAATLPELLVQAIQNLVRFGAPKDTGGHPEAVIAQLPELISALLVASTFRHSAAVRQAACQCLLAFSKFPVAHILSFKRLVTRGLKKTLDDPKRLVRQTASECANSWHLLASA